MYVMALYQTKVLPAPKEKQLVIVSQVCVVYFKKKSTLIKWIDL